MPPKRRSQAQATANDCNAQLLAAMQAMQNELRTLREARNQDAPILEQGAIAADGPPSGVSLIQWIGMKLDHFDGSGTPVQAADWLSYVEDKMEVFDVLAQDRIRYGTQLLKGEAQIWWKGVQSAHTAAHGPLTWPDFVRQLERRFYPVTFLDKMKIDLHSYVQGRRTVSEYEVGFNQIVRFVPHVAHDEAEKARQFRQGLKPSIRHTLGAFPVVDFRTMVEQALGVEMQEVYTEEARKSGGDQIQGQIDRKGHSGGPIHKKRKFQRHQPYRGSLGRSRTSGGSTTQYRAIPKPGMGMVCFRCGDAHRRSECRWSGKCSICGQDHKDVVCRRNANGKLRWEPVTSSNSGGTVQMMAVTPSLVPLPTPTPQ
ncbi:uncharacterized protein LOC133928650 isoform X2 [Phragmites australis]|nr:uncharacterized protein LOC133928650 isoform X2 [Phragmites australis]